MIDTDKIRADDTGSIWVISDMHLWASEANTCHAVENFLAALNQQKHPLTRGARALYLLGDLFEAWIGDDVQDSSATMLARGCQQLSDNNVNIYMQHGNRDFLIGQDYAKTCDSTLLPEYHVTDFFGQTVLLLHGDQLCTDDKDYQRLRTQLRSPQWMQHFLAMTPLQRQEEAKKYREASTKAQAFKTDDIIDINEQARLKTMRQYSVNMMIHGHTHRPAIHRYQDSSGQVHDCRAVLGAWHAFAHAIRVDSHGITLVRWPLDGSVNEATILDTQPWLQTTADA